MTDMNLQKVLEGAVPAVLFVYLFSVLTIGGMTLFAATLPIFTLIFAILGAWVLMRGSIRQMEGNSRAKTR